LISLRTIDLIRTFPEQGGLRRFSRFCSQISVGLLFVSSYSERSEASKADTASQTSRSDLVDDGGDDAIDYDGMFDGTMGDGHFGWNIHDHVNSDGNDIDEGSKDEYRQL